MPISDSYVHGIMDGEMLDLCRAGDLMMEGFTLT